MLRPQSRRGRFAAGRLPNLAWQSGQTSHLKFIYRFFANKQFLSLAVNTFIHWIFNVMFNPVHHHCYLFTDFYKRFTCAELKSLFIARKSDTFIFWRACLLVVPAGFNPRIYNIRTLHFNSSGRMDNDRIIVLFSLKRKPVETLLDSGATQNFMSMKYVKQNNIPLIKKITPRTFGSIKPDEKFRIKYETKPLWAINYTHKKQLVFDVFEKWKPIYLKIPLFRKYNPKIVWKSMQVTIKNQLFKIRKKLVDAKSVKTFARKIQINCDEFATLEFIPLKYREHSDVFENPEKKIPLPNILRTTTKSFWKHRGNWQPVLFTTQTKKKKRKLFRYI